MQAAVENWLNPDYTAIWRERKWLIDQIRARGNDGLLGARAHYAASPHDAIDDLVCTIDPRKKDTSKRISPFVMHPRQRELVDWIWDRYRNDEMGIIVKSREVGASWICLYMSWWLWEFHQDSHVTFGSQIARKVDSIGDLNALLPKLRFMIGLLPTEFKPPLWDEEKHAPLNRLRHTRNRSQIIGEAGDGIGRGGRASMVFLDEAAFLEHPKLVDASLSETSDAVIHLSTVNGTGNPFYEKVTEGNHPVFRFHWSEDPRKNAAWYAKKKRTLDPEILAAEVDLDFEASNTDMIVRGEWVRSSVALRQHYELMGDRIATKEKPVCGFDVADGGGAANVLTPRRGPWVDMPVDWYDGDVIDGAIHAEKVSLGLSVGQINFDSIGIGAGTAAAFRRLKGVRAVPVNVGKSATFRMWPDGSTANKKFINLKAECWWLMRDRLWRTHLHWLHLQGEKGGQQIANPADLLLLPDHKKLRSELTVVRYMRTETGKIQIESKKQLVKRVGRSPDFADSLVLTFAPAPVGVRSGRTKGLG